MILVKIKRSSIRKNPNAWRTETYINHAPDINFRIEGTTELPKFLKEGKDAIITSKCYASEFAEEYIEGYLINPKKAERLSKENGLYITIQNNIQTVRHPPEPEYLFKYENPKVECSNCHKKIPVNDIYSDYEDDEYYYEECPLCHSSNTFPERKYESITEAVENLNSK